MIRKLREKLNKNNDHGSSFILVIVATTFMCILVSALLMGALMTYKLKFYKLNSLNNFYEVETALDEIYAGVGAATNEHLYTAYTTTAELVVVYDTKTKTYTNLTEDDANALFKKLFMNGFISDTKYSGIKEAKSTLESFISNQRVVTKSLTGKEIIQNPDGVYLDTTNMQLVFTDANGRTKTEYFSGDNMKRYTQSTFKSEQVVSVAFRNICVKRSVDVKGTSGGTYVQSITTDIVLKEPEYNVSFDSTASSGSGVDDYALIADMGIDINTGNDEKSTTANVSTTANTVHISGNIYAASDFYNKDYNAVDATRVTTWYKKNQDLKWGTTDDSLYSGIYVNGNQTNVNLSSNVVVCAGTLGSHNGANLVVSGRSNSRSEVWADNIVLGGNKGGSLLMSADAYIYDDTELNAPNSSLSFTQGRYFGYSYNADDTRSLKYLEGTSGADGIPRLLATGYKLRAHFSDSAIIVNGDGSTLDLSKLDSLYIAGKSYIEFSKISRDEAKKWNNNTTNDSEKLTLDDVKNESQNIEAEYAYTNLTDYSTGQSLDVKSNQLMFLTQWLFDSENDDGTVNLRVPTGYEGSQKFSDMYSKYIEQNAAGDDIVKAIKQVVSGHTYYYLYIDDKNDEGLAEKFAEAYYDLWDNENQGDFISSNTYNVRNYKNFKVTLILPSDNDSIKTSASLTDQNKIDVAGNDNLFLRKSAITSLDVKKELKSVGESAQFLQLYENKSDTYDVKQMYADIENQANKLASSSGLSKEKQTSNLLSYMYINMKDHLYVSDRMETDETTKVSKPMNAWAVAKYTETVSDAGTATYDKTYNADKDEYSYNYSITPINQFVDMNKIISGGYSMNESVGKKIDGVTNRVIVSNGDVEVAATEDGKAQGIIIASGEVTFNSNVKSFRGLIITGSKVKINHVMDINADANYISGLLKQCAKTKLEDSPVSKVTSELLKNYNKTTEEKKTNSSTLSISDISYEDILTFQNWKRNVE